MKKQKRDTGMIILLLKYGQWACDDDRKYNFFSFLNNRSSDFCRKTLQNVTQYDYP